MRNATFSPADDCVVRESLYWTMEDIGAVQIYQFMCAVALIFTTCLGILGLLFPGGFILLIHGLASLGLFAATVMGIVLLSWWSFLWGLMFLFYLLYFLSDQWRIASASQVLLHVNAVIRVRPMALLFTLWNSVLQMGWFIGWGYVYITLNGRLTGWVDALLFLIYLWFANVFATVHFTAISGVVASWYFSKKSLSTCLRSVARCVTVLRVHVLRLPLPDHQQGDQGRGELLAHLPERPRPAPGRPLRSSRADPRGADSYGLSF